MVVEGRMPECLHQVVEEYGAVHRSLPLVGLRRDHAARAIQEEDDVTLEGRVLSKERERWVAVEVVVKDGFPVLALCRERVGRADGREDVSDVDVAEYALTEEVQ
jgi:hypothetical protein